MGGRDPRPPTCRSAIRSEAGSSAAAMLVANPAPGWLSSGPNTAAELHKRRSPRTALCKVNQCGCHRRAFPSAITARHRSAPAGEHGVTVHVVVEAEVASAVRATHGHRDSRLEDPVTGEQKQESLFRSSRHGRRGRPDHRRGGHARHNPTYGLLPPFVRNADSRPECLVSTFSTCAGTYLCQGVPAKPSR